jgi:hypothetical protein
MSVTNTRILNLNPESRDFQIGLHTRRGEAATPDSFQSFPYFKKIMVTVAGDVEYENQLGEAVLVPACQPGVEYNQVGRRILSLNTTATGIYVFTSE